jgi:hypothetical protein
MIKPNADPADAGQPKKNELVTEVEQLTEMSIERSFTSV